MKGLSEIDSPFFLLWAAADTGHCKINIFASGKGRLFQLRVHNNMGKEICYHLILTRWSISARILL